MHNLNVFIYSEYLPENKLKTNVKDNKSNGAKHKLNTGSKNFFHIFDCLTVHF